jgi:uncharacterized protein YraI
VKQRLTAAFAALAVLTAIPVSAAASEPRDTVTYRGLALPVPDGWTVYDLAERPETCVRTDQNAIYLGTPGPEQRCPARAIGRTESILVQPAPEGAGVPDAVQGAMGELPSIASTASEDQSARIVLDRTGLAVTATYRDHPERIDAVLREAAYTGPDRPTATADDEPVDVDAPAGSDENFAHGMKPKPGATSTRYNGRGFDTCTAPSRDAMRGWLRSSYRVVGIYIGGLNRACSDGNLDKRWVRKNAKDGWRFIPIYVGRQAPCANQSDLGEIRDTHIRAQGRRAAEDAVAKAQKFGLFAGSTLYNDMEAYAGGTTCRQTVLKFLSAWTKRLHKLGYLSGVYSSASSGIKHLAMRYESSAYVRPDAIWTARWDGDATVWDEEYVSDSYWPTYQRLKQHRGPHTESWGGYAIEIDSNTIEGPLASPKYRYDVQADVSLRSRSGPSTSYTQVGTHAAGSRISVICQVSGERIGSTKVWDKLIDGSYVSDEYVETPGKPEYTKPIPYCRYPYQVTTDLLRVRHGPSTSERKVNEIPRGGLAYIQCQDKGERIDGNRVWNRIGDGRWVSNAYTKTPGRPGYTEPIPRCR